MTRPFVFDPSAAFKKLAGGYPSPVSQMCRQTVRPQHAPSGENDTQVTHCFNDAIPTFAAQGDHSTLRMSLMSPVSQRLHSTRKLSGEDWCRFEERAAIMEYLGGLPRHVAEAMASINLVPTETEYHNG